MSKCPQCGYGELLTKHGRYGEFLGCSEFPDCRFTRSLDEISMKKLCPLMSCNGSGQLPFLKNGRIVPNAFVDCECQIPEETNRIPKLRDFDFPMSDTFRAHSFSYCEVPDPAESLAEFDNKEELERWGEYIVNGNPPETFTSRQERIEVKQAYGYRARQDVVELERKVSGLNKALANHMKLKKKGQNYQFNE